MAMDDGDSEDEDEDEEEEGDSDEGGNGNGASSSADAPKKSAHAIATERMRAKMTKLEAEQLAEKPWQLTGEVSAKARPTNSLLEADMDYDQGSKAAPIITEEVCRHTPLANAPLAQPS